jgi:hypothetical protein
MRFVFIIFLKQRSTPKAYVIRHDSHDLLLWHLPSSLRLMVFIKFSDFAFGELYGKQRCYQPRF